jgi:hypothetical protein
MTAASNRRRFVQELLMRRLLSSAIALLVVLSVPGYSPGQSPASAVTPAAPPIELRISGPRLIRRGQTLNFKVTLTNRSDKAIAVHRPFGMFDQTKLDWLITDTAGRPLAPRVYEFPKNVFVCPVIGPFPDRVIEVIQPGETIDFSYAGDPSDDFLFRGKGFYRVSLTYVLRQHPDVVESYHYPNEKPEAYTPHQKVEMFHEMFSATQSINATSNVWQLYLAD